MVRMNATQAKSDFEAIQKEILHSVYNRLDFGLTYMDAMTDENPGFWDTITKCNKYPTGVVIVTSDSEETCNLEDLKTETHIEMLDQLDKIAINKG